MNVFFFFLIILSWDDLEITPTWVLHSPTEVVLHAMWQSVLLSFLLADNYRYTCAITPRTLESHTKWEKICVLWHKLKRRRFVMRNKRRLPADSPGHSHAHGPLPAVKQAVRQIDQISLRITRNIFLWFHIKRRKPGKFRDKRQPFPDSSHVGLQSGDGARTSTEQNTTRLILCTAWHASVKTWKTWVGRH